MTTFTVDIKKEEDIISLKNYLFEKGLDFQIQDEYEGFIPEDKLKNMLKERKEEYLKSDRTMITPEESRAEIDKILAGKNKNAI